MGYSVEVFYFHDSPRRVHPVAAQGGVNGLFALGEANFADHGANKLGANSLLQACVDVYFVASLHG